MLNVYSRMYVDLSNFISPNLTWKGNRSRRSRKARARMFNVGFETSRNVQDTSASGTVKLGVIVPDFAERLANVPIKKRRLLHQSPLPTAQIPLTHEGSQSLLSQIPSPDHEVVKQLVEGKCTSAQLESPDSFRTQGLLKFRLCVSGFAESKISESTGGELGYSKDVSGIQLLASTVADHADGSLLAEEFAVSQGINSSVVDTKPTISPLESENSSIPDIAVSVLQNVHANANEGGVKDLVPSKDDRLNWDLNTAMDEWEEEPCNVQIVESQKIHAAGVDTDSLEGKELKLKSCDTICLVDKKTEHGATDNSAACDMASVICENKVFLSSGGTIFKQEKEDCNETSLIELVNPLSEKLQAVKQGDSTSDSPLQDVNPCEIVTIQEKNKLKAVKQENSCFDMPFLDLSTCKLLSIQEKTREVSGRTCKILDNTSSMDTMGTLTCNSLHLDNSSGKVNEAKSLHFIHKCEELSSSATSQLGKKDIVGDLGVQIEKASASNFSMHDFAAQVEPNQLMANYVSHVQKASSGDASMRDFCVPVDPNKVMAGFDEQPVPKEVDLSEFHFQKSCSSQCDDKFVSEDPLAECCGLDKSRDGKECMFSESVNKVVASCNPPFVDGELMELASNVPDKNEAGEKEIECLDYDSDNGYDDDIDTVERPTSKPEVCREVTKVEVEEDLLVENDFSVNYGMIEKRTVDKMPGVAIEQGTTRRRGIPDYKEDVILGGSDDNSKKCNRGIKKGHDELRASRGKMLRVEGSAPFNVLQREDNGSLVHSRSDDGGDSCSRAEKDFGSGKFCTRDRPSFQAHDTNEMDGVNSSLRFWESRKYCGLFRPRSIHTDSTSKSDGFSTLDYHQIRSHSPRGLYRPLNRRRSPDDRNDSYDMHRPPLNHRGLSHDRSRIGSRFCPQGFRRDPQEEYVEPRRYHLERKERCFSPCYNRGGYVSQHWMRPRSKSRSPFSWRSERARNVEVGPPSPEIIPKGRFQGERDPFQKPSFSSDFEDYTHGDRGRLSPQHKSRCFDDRNFVDDRYRDGRLSPVRMFRQSQRFDSVGYSERLVSDDYFRPRSRPGRFMQMGDRESKFRGGHDGSRKNDDKYEAMTKVRRYDTSGVRLFRYNGEDSFDGHSSRHADSFYGGAFGRDVDGSSSGERGSSRYKRERRFATASLVNWEREYDIDTSPREG